MQKVKICFKLFCIDIYLGEIDVFGDWIDKFRDICQEMIVF